MCVVAGLRDLSVMVGLGVEQNNIVSRVEWITAAGREQAGCFLCQNRPPISTCLSPPRAGLPSPQSYGLLPLSQRMSVF